MSLFEGILLGLVQGLTEFIPVSSSGHLIVIHHFFGVAKEDLAIDAVLQLATVLAVFLYFRSDVWNLLVTFIKLISGKSVEARDRNVLFAIILGTIPAVVLGLVLESYMESFFRSTTLVALTLILGSVLMYHADTADVKAEILTPQKGLVIGFFQSLALIPGISRSGSTISGGLLSGLQREEATRFSFLLSFPIILGSGLKKLFDLSVAHEAVSFPLGVSFIVSFLTGLVCIHFLIKYLRSHSLRVFIWYRVVLAVLLLILL